MSLDVVSLRLEKFRLHKSKFYLTTRKKYSIIYLVKEEYKMWEKKRCAHERDMVWFCARCEKMMYWKTKGWENSALPYRIYCDECKEKMEKSGIK